MPLTYYSTVSDVSKFRLFRKKIAELLTPEVSTVS